MFFGVARGRIAVTVAVIHLSITYLRARTRLALSGNVTVVLAAACRCSLRQKKVLKLADVLRASQHQHPRRERNACLVIASWMFERKTRGRGRSSGQSHPFDHDTSVCCPPHSRAAPASHHRVGANMHARNFSYLPTQAVTVYSLYSADMERVHLKLRATFRNSLRLPVSPFSAAACRVFSDVGYRGERGQVQIEVVEGGHRSDLG